MLRPAFATLALLSVAACETTAGGGSPAVDEAAVAAGQPVEAISEPTDGLENEIEAE